MSPGSAIARQGDPGEGFAFLIDDGCPLTPTLSRKGRGSAPPAVAKKCLLAMQMHPSNMKSASLPKEGAGNAGRSPHPQPRMQR
jgi:hypothetical protein